MSTEASAGERSALSVVIPTAPRRESLRETLRALGAGCPRDLDVLVVDNSPSAELDDADVVVDGLRGVRLLHEPRRGKSHALNRALQAELGSVVAVLDDDMVPMAGWADAVIASARARPDYDVFAGRSHVVWPDGVSLPAWAHHPLATGIAFSVIDFGPDADVEMGVQAIGHPSGNHFWFRRSVLDTVGTFPDVWTTEVDFVVALRAQGHRGVFVREVTCGHRVQPRLLEADTFLARATDLGRAKARVQLLEKRLRGGPQVAGHSPWIRAALWRARSSLWLARGALARLRDDANSVPARARAAMQAAYFCELRRKL
jgi:GT2 family glycosyltransferase